MNAVEQLKNIANTWLGTEDTRVWRDLLPRLQEWCHQDDPEVQAFITAPWDRPRWQLRDPLYDIVYTCCTLRTPEFDGLLPALVTAGVPVARLDSAAGGDSIRTPFTHAAMWQLSDSEKYGGVERPKMHTTRLEEILAAGCSPNSQFLSQEGRWYGITPIYRAIGYQDLDAMRVLLDAGAEPNDSPWDNYSCPLIYMLTGMVGREGIREDMLRLLVAHGADVNRVCTWKVHNYHDDDENIMSMNFINYVQREPEIQGFRAGLLRVCMQELGQPVSIGAGWQLLFKPGLM